MAEQEHYTVLGVTPDASVEAIRKAYRALALANHPDKLSVEDREAGTRRLAAINRAYGVLKDEDKRRIYDLQRSAGGIGDAGQAGGGGSSRRWRGPLSPLRRLLVGRGAPAAFGWASEVAELSDRNAPRHLRPMAAGPVLVFVHIGGSERCRRAIAVLKDVSSALRGIGAVRSLDIEGEPKLQRMLGLPPDLDLPAVALLAPVAGATTSRLLSPPYDAKGLLEAVAEAMPRLPPLHSVCSAGDLRRLTAGGKRGGQRQAAAAVIVPRASGGSAGGGGGSDTAEVVARMRLRLLSLGLRGTLAPAAQVASEQCAAFATLSHCEGGVALLSAGDAAVRGCIPFPEASGNWRRFDDSVRRHGRPSRGLPPSVAVLTQGSGALTLSVARFAARSLLALSESPAGVVMLDSKALPLWACLFFALKMFAASPPKVLRPSRWARSARWRIRQIKRWWDPHK